LRLASRTRWSIYDLEIIFDKTLERYRFNTLLPKYIPYKVFYKLFQDSIVNNIIKDGRFKQNFHYKKEIKGKTIKITFVEDGILAYKKEKGLK
jgi:hypothetical protein